MERLEIESEIKKLLEKLNPDKVKQINKCLQDLTTSGSPSLLEADIKKFKRLCRESDDYVRYAFFLIMKQLKKKHSEIRLSAFQVADELFNRSHAFRELLVLHLQSFLTFTTAIEAKQPLPPPLAAANRLKTDTLLAVQRWYEKFGKGYRKLAVAYDYLKDCRYVDFSNLQAQNQAERLRIEKEEKKKQKIMAEKVSKIIKEINEMQQDIVNCATEAENCLKLLLPTTKEDFFLDFTPQPELDLKIENTKIVQTGNISKSISEKCPANNETEHTEEKDKICENQALSSLDDKADASDDDNIVDEDDASDDENEMLAHGYKDCKFTLCLEIPEKVCLKETMDNTDVMQSLKDASKLISSKYLPKVIRWLEILSKNGGQDKDIKSSIDLKVQLENIQSKCLDLQLVTMETKMKDQEDSDSDFEVVPEKEGYEPYIPQHLRAEYGLMDQTVKNVQTSVTKSPAASCSKTCITATNPNKTSSGWSLKKHVSTQDVNDPTSMANALARIRSDSKHLGEALSSQEKEAKVSTEVPFVEFGVDLAYWENPDQIEVPSIIKLDSLHRFWAPKETETEKPSQHEISALKNRVFSFPGKFEPVKWKCRAPLPDGKLCERMDRYKCPFHGKVIARDNEGKPSQPLESTDVKVRSMKQEDISTNLSAEDCEKLPPWLDPELQRDIEQATGHDLGSVRSQKLLEKKTKGKGKGKRKQSNLTDINAVQNTARKRLGDKIFNKRSLKKVCANLDDCDYKRVRDKFENQFHYSLH